MLFANLDLFGQTTFTNPVPPSPESAKIAQFSLAPPKLYTGTHSVNLPLYSFDFDGKQIGLSLSYHGSGVRVAEDAGIVGLGWAIAPPGNVHRSIKGFDDLGKSPNRYFFGHLNDYIPIPESWNYSWWDTYLVGARKDTEPDIFSYSFLNTSGKFFLKKKTNSGSAVEIVKLKPNGDKIVFDEITSTLTITDSEGFIGLFSIKEYSTSVSGNCTSYSNCPETGIDFLDILKSGGRAINTWHLSKIISPKGKELSFFYDINSTNGFSDYMSISQPSWSEQNSVSSSNFVETENSKSFGRTINENIYLTSITSIDLDLKIQFNYGTRGDIQSLDAAVNAAYGSWRTQINSHDRGGYSGTPKNPQKLQSIAVTNLNSSSLLNFPITFTQSFFNGSTITPSMSRLKLDQVLIGDQKYKFQYFEGLPSKSSRGIDYWGYYNGRNSNSTLLPVVSTNSNFGISYLANYGDYLFYQNPNRSPDFIYGQAGLLHTVVYPTGGRNVVEYESHDYKMVGGEIPTPYTASRQIHARDAPQTYTTYYAGYGTNGCSAITFTLTVRCGNYCNPAYPPHSCSGTQPTCTVAVADHNKVAAEVIGPNNQVVAQILYSQLWALNTNIDEMTFVFPNHPISGPFLPAGNYTIKAYGITENSVSRYYGSAKVELSSNCQSPSGTTAPIVNQKAGGARIKTSTLFNENMNLIERKRYEYKMFSNAGQAASQSSGKLVNPLMQFSQFSMGTGVLFYHYTSGSALENGNAAQGSHIGYKEVRVISEGKNGISNGYEDFRFRNLTNKYESYDQYNAILGTRFISFEDENGLDSAFSGSNSQAVVLEENFPSHIKVQPQTFNAVKLTYRGSGRPETTFYNFKSEGWQLYSKITYKEGFQSHEYYEYNNYGQLKKLTTYNSGGKTIIINKKYPLDTSSPSGIIATLHSKNIVGQPYETQETVNGQTTSATGILHKTVTIGGTVTPVLSKIFSHNTDVAFSSSSGNSFAGGYFEAKDITIYDSKGNPIEILDNQLKKSALIWGYNLIYPIAIVDNASTNQISYTSFETNEKGGWTYSGTPVNSSSSKTGRKNYNLSTGAITKSSIPTGSYKLSFWARTASGTTNWMFLGVSESLTTSWKLIERTVTSTSIDIPTGSIWIDELRLHPSSSLMTTSTYDPMVGATSVTDASSKTTYYEYDLLGRLIRIKDQDGYILKQFQYNYSNPN